MPCSHLYIKGAFPTQSPVGAGIRSLAVASVRRLAVKPLILPFSPCCVLWKEACVACMGDEEVSLQVPEETAPA